MRIKGRFWRFDAPFVRAKLVCEELNIEKSIDFLLDIGASSTTITDNDANRLKIDYDRLQKLERGLAGIGGLVERLRRGRYLYYGRC